MKLYAFTSATQPRPYGLMRDRGGANLPPPGPCKEFKAVELNHEDGAPLGVDSAAVLIAISDQGFYVTYRPLVGVNLIGR
jgi:hypothetical protein